MKHGQRFTAKIYSVFVSGIIWKEGREYFLLQNKKFGNRPQGKTPEKYKASWCIGAGTERHLRNNNVTCLRFTTDNKKIIESLI